MRDRMRDRIRDRIRDINNNRITVRNSNLM